VTSAPTGAPGPYRRLDIQAPASEQPERNCGRREEGAREGGDDEEEGDVIEHRLELLTERRCGWQRSVKTL
jgi:hypothetical protein